MLLNSDAAQLNVLSGNVQHTASEWPRVLRRTADMPLEETGCQVVLLADHPVAIPDTMEHPVLCHVPWSTMFRGYMGTLLRYQGENIGTICVLTVQPRNWTTQDKLTLEGIAQLATQALETP